MAHKKSHLSDEQLQELRELLLQKRHALVSDLEDLQRDRDEKADPDSGGGELSNLPTHPADMGTDVTSRELTMRMIARQRDLLEEIDQALGRTEDGTYGICQGTNEPISIERLRAKPWAKYGLDYAKTHEAGNRAPPYRAG